MKARGENSFMADKKGIVDISGLSSPPEKHELEVANYFAGLGKDIKFIEPARIKGAHTPDIEMDGIAWEIKCPKGKSKRTIENNFRHAVRQSHYIIFDLRHIGVSEKQCIAQLETEFGNRGYVKRLLVIKKDGTHVEFPKK